MLCAGRLHRGLRGHALELEAVNGLRVEHTAGIGGDAEAAIIERVVVVVAELTGRAAAGLAVEDARADAGHDAFAVGTRQLSA